MEPNLESTKINSKSDSVSWLEDSGDSQQTGADPFLHAACAISDRLEIIGRIGKGGMAVVYKAKHLVMNKLVAVKLLLPHLTSDPTSLKRFQQEAQATATLNHPNIVHIHDCGLTDGQAFIIMDFIDGQSLEQVIQKEGKFAPERALEIFVQISEALNHAHERGIIHRDLKPSNVMLTSDKNGFDMVKVVDFGIAKLLMNDNGETMQNLTQTGDVFGSPLYMSPEQCSGQKLDNRSDIYSLGCLMYEVLTGQPPIVGKNFLDTMQKHLTELPAPFVAELTKSALSKRMQVIVFTCLAKEPSARYSSMKAIASDLKTAITSGQGSTSAWKVKEKSVAQIVRKASARKRIVQNVLAFTSISLLLAGSYWLISAVNQPSGFENKPLFELVELKTPKVSPSYEKDQIILIQDIQSMSSSHSELETASAEESLASFYMKNGKWTEAKNEYTKLSAEEEGAVKSADIQKNIGLCNLRLNNFPEAEKHMQRFLDIFLASQNGIQVREKTNATLRELLDGAYGVSTISVRSVFSYLALIAEREDRLDAAENYARLLVESAQSSLEKEKVTLSQRSRRTKRIIVTDSAGDLKSELALDLAYLADIVRRRKSANAIYDFKNAILDKDDLSVADRDAKLSFGLGLSYLQDGQFKNAAAEFDSARNIITKIVGDDNSEADPQETRKAEADKRQLIKAINQEYCRALWKDGQYFQALLEKLKTSV